LIDRHSIATDQIVDRRSDTSVGVFVSAIAIAIAIAIATAIVSVGVGDTRSSASWSKIQQAIDNR